MSDKNNNTNLTDEEKLLKILTLANKLKKQYIKELENGNIEKAEEIKTVVVNSLIKAKALKKKIVLEKELNNLSDTIKINEKAKTKYFEKNSLNIKREISFSDKIFSIKVYYAILFVSLFLFSLIFCIFQFVSYKIFLQKASTGITHYLLIHNSIAKVIDVILLIATSLFFIFVKDFENKAFSAFFIISGLILAFPFFGGIPAINFNSRIFQSSSGGAAFLGIFIFIGLYFFFPNLLNSSDSDEN